MSKTVQIDQLLPTLAPDNRPARLLLYVIRRMGAHGINDAHATNALIGNFGLNYRRPLVLIRALMLEIARASHRHITIAACCCRRMTPHEVQLLDIIASALRQPQSSHDKLSALLDCHSCLGALTSAQAVAQAFGDLGHPVERA